MAGFRCPFSTHLGLSRNIGKYQQIGFVRNLSLSQQQLNSTTATSTAREQPTSPASKIVIPKRIKRSPTAVLEALGSTVKKDFDAPSYKYIDDPYLIPTSNLEKRSYSLAKAAGQKAAKFVLEEYPRYFANDVAEPSIESYLPTKPYLHSDDQEAGVLERIKARKPLDAYEAYQKTKVAGNEISDSTLEKLLELLCVYNSDNPVPPLLREENVYKRELGQDTGKKIIKTWKDDGAAEEVFVDLPNKTPRAYRALVKGRAKYYQVQKAYELFQEMKEKKIPVDVATYNAIIGVSSFAKDRPDLRHEILVELLQNMKDEGLMPNLNTFINVFYVLSRSQKHPDCFPLASKVLNEMKKINIEPSLAVWFYVVQIFYQHDESQHRILHEIVDHLKGKDLVLQNPIDVEFFCAAMSKCYMMKDMELAHKLDSVLNHGQNYALIGDSFKEGIYYTNYLRLLCMFEQIDTIMEHYDRITPHVYTPTFLAMDELLKAIELNEGYEHLPRIWSDLVTFDYMRRTDLVELLLASMAKKKHDDQLQDLLVEITQNLKTTYENDLASRTMMKPLQLSGPMFGDLILINVHAEKYDNAWEFFEMYYANKNEIDRFPNEAPLEKLTTYFIENSDTKKALKCLSVMSDCAYPKLDALADRIITELDLTSDERSRVEDML